MALLWQHVEGEEEEMLKTIQGWWHREEGAEQKPGLTLAITRIMVGMMTVDGIIDDTERAEITNMLGDFFDLTPENAEAILAEAIESKDTFSHVIRQIDEKYDMEDRIALLAKLWRVALADGNVSFLEERYINRIASLIGVDTSALKQLKAREEEMFPDLEHSERHQNPRLGDQIPE